MSPETLESTARRVGHACWVERRCFELLGGWVTSTPEPEAKIVFARQSHHHAWHAELFARVLPSANGFSADGLVTPPNAEWSALVDDLAELSSTRDRLVGAYEIMMPATSADYERWLEAVDPIRDAPLRRWLGFVVTDLQADLAEGRAVMAASVAPDAAQHRARLQAAFDRAGSFLGPYSHLR